MAPLEEPSPDPAQQLDWPALQQLARRLLRHRLGGFDPDDLDDAVSETQLRCLRWIRRAGPPRSDVAMVCQVARGVAADWIRRKRDRPPHDALEDPDEAHFGATDEREMLDALDELRWWLFVMVGLMSGRHEHCADIAAALGRGARLSDHAAEIGVPEPRVRQWWHRCRRVVTDAIRQGRLRLPWRGPGEG